MLAAQTSTIAVPAVRLTGRSARALPRHPAAGPAVSPVAESPGDGRGPGAGGANESERGNTGLGEMVLPG